MGNLVTGNAENGKQMTRSASHAFAAPSQSGAHEKTHPVQSMENANGNGFSARFKIEPDSPFIKGNADNNPQVSQDFFKNELNIAKSWQIPIIEIARQENAPDADSKTGDGSACPSARKRTGFVIWKTAAAVAIAFVQMIQGTVFAKEYKEENAISCDSAKTAVNTMSAMLIANAQESDKNQVLQENLKIIGEQFGTLKTCLQNNDANGANIARNAMSGAMRTVLETGLDKNIGSDREILIYFTSLIKVLFNKELTNALQNKTGLADYYNKNKDTIEKIKPVAIGIQAQAPEVEGRQEIRQENTPALNISMQEADKTRILKNNLKIIADQLEILKTCLQTNDAEGAIKARTAMSVAMVAVRAPEAGLDKNNGGDLQIQKYFALLTKIFFNSELTNALQSKTGLAYYNKNKDTIENLGQISTGIFTNGAYGNRVTIATIPVIEQTPVKVPIPQMASSEIKEGAVFEQSLELLYRKNFKVTDDDKIKVETEVRKNAIISLLGNYAYENKIARKIADYVFDNNGPINKTDFERAIDKPIYDEIKAILNSAAENINKNGLHILGYASMEVIRLDPKKLKTKNYEEQESSNIKLSNDRAQLGKNAVVKMFEQFDIILDDKKINVSGSRIETNPEEMCKYLNGEEYLHPINEKTYKLGGAELEDGKKHLQYMIKKNIIGKNYKVLNEMKFCAYIADAAAENGITELDTDNPYMKLHRGIKLEFAPNLQIQITALDNHLVVKPGDKIEIPGNVKLILGKMDFDRTGKEWKEKMPVTAWVVKKGTDTRIEGAIVDFDREKRLFEVKGLKAGEYELVAFAGMNSVLKTEKAKVQINVKEKTNQVIINIQPIQTKEVRVPINIKQKEFFAAATNVPTGENFAKLDVTESLKEYEISKNAKFQYMIYEITDKGVDFYQKDGKKMDVKVDISDMSGQRYATAKKGDKNYIIGTINGSVITFHREILQNVKEIINETPPAAVKSVDIETTLPDRMFMITGWLLDPDGFKQIDKLNFPKSPPR